MSEVERLESIITSIKSLLSFERDTALAEIKGVIVNEKAKDRAYFLYGFCNDVLEFIYDVEHESQFKKIREKVQ